MIDDLKLLKGTGETTIVPSSEIIAGDGYYYHHDIKRLFLYHVENFDYTLNDLDEVTNSDIEELVLCACPNINISLPIANWAHLTSLTIDEFSLTPGTYDSTYGTYDPPIWGDLLADIKAIGTATGSKLHTLKLDSLVSVGDNVLFNITTGYGCSSLVEASFKKLESAGNSFLSNCPNLTSVSLPSLEEAGNYSLYGCTSLEDVSLPLLESAGEGLLRWCTSLTIVSLPLLASAGEGLLYECTKLKRADLPSLETVESNSWGLLENCYDLEEVSLPKLITGGNWLLAFCTSLERIYFGKPEITWGNNAFSGVTLSNVDLYLPVGHGITGNTWNNKTWKSINEYPGDAAWDLL